MLLLLSASSQISTVHTLCLILAQRAGEANVTTTSTRMCTADSSHKHTAGVSVALLSARNVENSAASPSEGAGRILRRLQVTSGGWIRETETEKQKETDTQASSLLIY